MGCCLHLAATQVEVLKMQERLLRAEEDLAAVEVRA
jgi:hypothetical protein